jgi:hypothetical protein
VPKRVSRSFEIFAGYKPVSKSIPNGKLESSTTMTNLGESNYSLYGLPEKVEHCSKCLMHNQKPFSVNETTNFAGSKKRGMPVDTHGICAACHYNERKDEGIDWQDREQQLLAMLEIYRRDDGQYDCIVSGSGGKDSMTIAHLLKYKYGMHP